MPSTPFNDLFVFNTAHKTEFAVFCSFQYFAENGMNRLALLMPRGPLGDLGSLLARRIGERTGITIVDEEKFDLQSPDVYGQLARLRAEKAPCPFLLVTGRPAAAVAEGMAKLLHEDPPFFTSHGNANPSFLR